MPAPLVECIPNFSEARRPEVIDQIIEAIQSVTGVQILDRHSDLDHNRTVVTYIGAPGAVEEAAFRAIQCAAKRSIWMSIPANTRASAPRMWCRLCRSVTPPWKNASRFARRLGKRVGQELGIPTYLYEEAATRPERQNLENIRRGQYEGLKEEIKSNPDRQPDFGPGRIGPGRGNRDWRAPPPGGLQHLPDHG